MCLSLITKLLPGTFSGTYTTGYKVLEKTSGDGLTFPYCEPGREVRMSEMMIAKLEVVETEDNGFYVSGFHVFPDRNEAENYCRTRYWEPTAVLVEVEYDAVTTEGIQYVRNRPDTRVVVARVMRVIKRLPVPSE